MNSILEYAPILIAAVIFFLQYKIFVTPKELTELKSNLIEYISEHYVSEKTYRDNNFSLEKRIDGIDKNVNEIKNMLINYVQKIQSWQFIIGAKWKK